MRRLITALAIAALLGLASISARAQERLIIPVDQGVPAIPAHSDRMSRDNLLAIGTGVILGTIALPAFYPIEGAPVIGAVLGGIIGDYWYGIGSDVVLKLHSN